MTTTERTVATVWKLCTYDVWGNDQDGYDVNDSYCIDGACQLDIPVETHNQGTNREFDSASPTDEQIKAAFGIYPHVEIEMDGDDLHIKVNATDGYPIGEMYCISHESLSPIKPA